MDRQRLDLLWSDPRNHRANGCYHCKEDPRIIVPKRREGTGWTINLAHPRSWWVPISMPLMVLIPVAISVFAWPKTGLGVVAATLLGGLAVVIVCFWLNERTK